MEIRIKMEYFNEMFGLFVVVKHLRRNCHIWIRLDMLTTRQDIISECK